MKNFLSNPIQRRYIAHLIYTFAFRKAQGRLTSTSFSLIEIYRFSRPIAFFKKRLTTIDILLGL